MSPQDDGANNDDSGAGDNDRRAGADRRSGPDRRRAPDRRIGDERRTDTRTDPDTDPGTDSNDERERLASKKTAFDKASREESDEPAPAAGSAGVVAATTRSTPRAAIVGVGCAALLLAISTVYWAMASQAREAVDTFVNESVEIDDGTLVLADGSDCTDSEIDQLEFEGAFEPERVVANGFLLGSAEAPFAEPTDGLSEGDTIQRLTLELAHQYGSWCIDHVEVETEDVKADAQS